MTSCARCSWHPDRDLTDDAGQRVPARTQLQLHAEDKAHPLCLCCRNSLTEHEPQVCETCLTAVQGNVKLIVKLHAELPAHLGQPSGQSFGRRGGDEHTLPGGTVMAMLGPGSAGGTSRRLTKLDRERGVEGREHIIDNDPGDPPSVMWTLYSWALDWSEIRGDVLMAVTVPDIAGFLEVNGRWAGNQHPAFDAYAAEMRALRGQLEDVTGRTRKPTKAGASCFECSNDLVRKVDPDTGLEDDHVTCAACRQQYSEARYRMACRNAAEDASQITVEGETYATPGALAQELGRSPHTLRVWAQRDGLCRWIPRGGVVFVHVDEATAVHDERKTRRRTA